MHIPNTITVSMASSVISRPPKCNGKAQERSGTSLCSAPPPLFLVRSGYSRSGKYRLFQEDRKTDRNDWDDGKTMQGLAEFIMDRLVDNGEEPTKDEQTEAQRLGPLCVRVPFRLERGLWVMRQVE